MARATEWRRQVDEYANSVTKSNTHIVALPSIAAGETIGRIRFVWQAMHDSAQPFDGSGFVVGAGITVVPDGFDPGLLPFPVANPDADWMWWEAGILQPIFGSTKSSTFFELDTYPVNDCIRDCKAQRKADVSGSDVYFITDTTSLSTGQCDHYLSLTSSMLVILAP